MPEMETEETMDMGSAETKHEMHSKKQDTMPDMKKNMNGDTDAQQKEAEGRTMDMDMDGEGMFDEYHYNFLKSTEKKLPT